jgi:hypothetical protein
LFHNEALVAIDLVVQASVIAAGVDVPPATPEPGQAWLIGAAPSGAWAGRAGQLAGWSAGGWRFAAPVEGMTVWIADRGETARYRGGGWIIGEVAASRLVIDGKQVVGARGAAIAAPSGGAFVDAEARAAIASILAMLRAHGLIAA